MSYSKNVLTCLLIISFTFFQAILEHDIYPDSWLTILIVVFCKPGKPEYNIAKAYHPIGVLETIGKLFSTLVTSDLSFLVEKHSLLPLTPFGGRPSRCTTDVIHLVTMEIKDAQ